MEKSFGGDESKPRSLFATGNKSNEVLPTHLLPFLSPSLLFFFHFFLAYLSLIAPVLQICPK